MREKPHLQKPIQLILTALLYRHRAEHQSGEEQEAQVVHCAEDCGRGGAQEGGVDRARESVRKGDARVSVVRGEDLPQMSEFTQEIRKGKRRERAPRP
jgi:hypothetical protein